MTTTLLSGVMQFISENLYYIVIGAGALGIWLGTVPVVLGVACVVQLAAAAGLWGLATRMRMP